MTINTTMKKIYTLLFLLATVFAFSACSESEGFDPYRSQEKRPMYPAVVSFSSVDNDDTGTDKKWEFTYNADNTIKAYKYSNHVITKSGVEIIENHSGKLIYYTDAAGVKWIQNDLVVSNVVKDVTSEESYCDTIKEDVKIISDLIHSIKTTGQRTYSNGTYEIYSNTRDFSYTDKYCTGSSYTHSLGTTTYRYDWGNAQLKRVTVYEQGNNNSMSQMVYNYQHSKRELACDYGFNTLSFVYGNFPEVYAAMNLFGETSAYEIESENYSGYRNINGTRYDISPVSRSYSLLESNNSVTYAADSPNFISYFFTFAK